jgi:hypothetical protein
MSNLRKEFNQGQEVWLDIDKANYSKVEVVFQTPNKLFTTVKNIENREWEVMTDRLSPMLTSQQQIYLSDEMYTPIHYKGMIVEQPFFEGKGNHSVAQLEALCEQYKEYVHQQQIIKHNCMKHIVELKFGVAFPQNDA